MTGPRIVRDAELEYDSDLVATLLGEPFSGVAYEESPVLGRSEISYRDGLQDGPAQDWYPAGTLKGESQFRQGVLHGVSREFDHDGNVSVEVQYEYGIRTLATHFGGDGVVTSTEALDPNDEASRQLARLRVERNWQLDV